MVSYQTESYYFFLFARFIKQHILAILPLYYLATFLLFSQLALLPKIQVCHHLGSLVMPDI